MQEVTWRGLVILNRAVPGSGKTTFSNKIIETLKESGISVKIHSTDDFFLTSDGRYEFNIEMLSKYHSINLANFKESLYENVQVVICDNINLVPWQTEPYTSAAKEQGYFTLCLTFAPRELARHAESQQVTDKKPDAHQVPEDVLIRFITEYETYTPLLLNRGSINPEVHKDFRWDSLEHTRVETGSTSKNFDVDHVICINPNEYHVEKGRIGSKILKIFRSIQQQSH